jgi:hypothetical protein
MMTAAWKVKVGPRARRRRRQGDRCLKIVLAARARGARVSPQRKKVEAKEGVVKRENRLCEASKGARRREGIP